MTLLNFLEIHKDKANVTIETHSAKPTKCLIVCESYTRLNVL